jgi:hypothetical protein
MYLYLHNLLRYALVSGIAMAWPVLVDLRLHKRQYLINFIIWLRSTLKRELVLYSFNNPLALYEDSSRIYNNKKNFKCRKGENLPAPI